MTLCAAFGKELSVLNSWVDGQFETAMPQGMCNDRLIILAHYFSAAEYSDYNHTLGFYFCQLVIAYGMFLHTCRNTTEDPEITSALISCQIELRFDHRSCFLIFNEAEKIKHWSQSIQKKKIFRAAENIERIIKRWPYMYENFVPMSDRSYSRQTQAEADRITALIGAYIDRNKDDWQELLAKEPFGVTDRIRYFNSAAMRFWPPRITEDGFVDPQCILPGIPARKLEAMVQNGLLGKTDASPNFWRNSTNNNMR